MDEAMWQILPKEGLGRLRFGMTPAEVDRLADIYGTSKGLASDRISEDLLASTIRDLGDALSPEEKQEIIALYQSDGPSNLSVTEVRGDKHPLVLTYENDRLVEILMNVKSKQVKFSDTVVFEASPRDVIRNMSETTGEKPVFLREEVVFPDNLIFLFEFLRERTSQTSTEPTIDGDPKERSIVLRSKPTTGGMDLSLYKPLVF
jgi:hypothetical protein